MTVNLSNEIDTLREEGFEDDVILRELRDFVGDLYGSEIDTLQEEGFDASVIIDNMRDLPLDYEDELGLGDSLAAGAIEGVVGMSGLPIAELAEPYMPLQEGREDLTLPRNVDQQLGEIEEPSFTQGMAAMMGDEDILPPSQIGVPPSTREAVTDPTALSPSLSLLSSIEKSEEGLPNILRGATRGATASIPFGPTGVLMGTTGGAAGAYTEEKTGSPWLGLAADLITGAGTGLAADLLKVGAKTPSSVNPMFMDSDSRLTNRAVKAITSGKKADLEGIISRASADQLSAFEREASEMSPNRFSQMAATDLSSTERNANEAFRQGQLNRISPNDFTKREAFEIIRDTANTHFNEVIRPAERRDYTLARDEAAPMQGKLNSAVESTQGLADQIESLSVREKEEMGPILNFLRNLLEDIGIEQLPVEELTDRLIQAFTEGETSVLSRLGFASQEEFLNFLTRSGEQELSKAAESLGLLENKTLNGNQMIDLIQRANTWVGYENTNRTFSKRLTTIVNDLKSDTMAILGDSEAAKLLQNANDLYSSNARTWGTDYMKRIRFSQVPEDNLVHTLKETNYRNLKDAIFQYEEIPGMVERQMADGITRDQWAQVSKSLTPEANQAIEKILNLKDALANPTSRKALRLSVLDEVTQSLITGQHPSQTMDVMNTVKGYEFLKSTFTGKKGKEVFNSLERLFVDDLLKGVTDDAGRIDFKKAAQILKNDEISGVVQRIGGEELLNRFRNLENMSKNFTKNIDKFSPLQWKDIFQEIGKTGRNWSSAAAVLYWLGAPTQLIAGLGVVGLGVSGTRMAMRKVVDAALKNPKIYSVLENVTRARTPEEMVKYLTLLEPMLNNAIDAETLEELD